MTEVLKDGVTLDSILKQFGTSDNQLLKDLELHENMLQSIVRESEEELVLKELSESLSMPVENILKYKYSMFDTFKRLGATKEHILEFHKEVKDGRIKGTTYCDCVIGKIMRYQRGENWQRQVYIHGRQEPIENFVKDITFKDNPDNNLKMKALDMWTQEYLDVVF